MLERGGDDDVVGTVRYGEEAVGLELVVEANIDAERSLSCIVFNGGSGADFISLGSIVWSEVTNAPNYPMALILIF